MRGPGNERRTCLEEPKMIILMGATGTVGSALMARLSGDGVRARALAHSPQGRTAIESQGLDPVEGDFDQPETLDAAFEGCDRLFLLSPPHPEQAQREKVTIDAASRAGVLHVVAMSVMGADRSSPSAFARWHADVDEHLVESGLDYTILRPAGFMQTHLWPIATLRSEDRWYGMTGDGAAAFIDAEDIAAAAAAALTATSHSRSIVELTGPVAISMPQAADELGGITGRPITYVDVPEEDYRSNLGRVGLPDWLSDAIVALYRGIRAGHAATVTDGVQRLTGHPARDYREFAETHRSDLVNR